MTDGDPSCLDHTGCFSLLLTEGALKLKLGSQMLSSRGVYNAYQPGFLLHLLADQLQKAGVSGDSEDG